MVQEAKNAEFRRARIEYAMVKARIGEDRRMQRVERERLEKVCLSDIDDGGFFNLILSGFSACNYDRRCIFQRLFVAKNLKPKD